MLNDLTLLAPFLLLFSFVVSYSIIPKIVQVVHYKHLMDDPNERSSHSIATPNLGGIAFFIAIMLSFYFSQRFDVLESSMSIIPGLIILFILGIKDDLVVLSPLTKLIGQIAAGVFLLFDFKFGIKGLHGFMGVEELSLWLAFPLALFIIIAIINAVNLIDGIDGLAATVSISVFTVFAIIFYQVDNYFLFLTCLVMVGSLLAFLRFNFSKANKIFMGDTGSMILGFMMSVMVLRFLMLEDAALAKLPFEQENIPYVVFAILIVPFFDTARVFFIRLMNRRSPFSPDRNHIHHVIIDHYQISHGKASLWLGAFHFVAIIFLSGMAMLVSQWYMLLIMSVVLFAAVAYFFFINKPRILRAMKYQKRIKVWRKHKMAS
jgi:UDP-N-acetylmuramyl pentapeptide phosphotransferase/UDP-N-acetylglucosamine-1-phosphate transferase